MPVPEPAARSPKAEQTRSTILESAMRLFAENGYDKTTMRAIAGEAGVSLGNAYYYFGSKEHLIQGFYEQLEATHEERVTEVLARETTFPARLGGVLHAWLDVAAPSHAFAGQFFKNAADPRSPLSPFSPESAETRDAAIGTFTRLLDGAEIKLAPALRAELPELLWMLQMGMVLFWVYDDSEAQQRSHTLVDGLVPMIDRMVRMSRLPVVRGLVDDLLSLMANLRG